MKNLVSFSPFLTVLMMGHYGYFLVCIKNQFKFSMPCINRWIFGGGVGMILFLLVGLSPFTILGPYQRFCQGAFLGLGSFSFLSFYGFFLNKGDDPKRKKVLGKLPFFGALLGWSVARMVEGFPLRAMVILFFVPPLVLLHSHREKYRTSFRSFFTFFVFLVFSQAAGAIDLLEGCLWSVGSFFLFQSLNVFLVKQYVSENL